MFGFLFTEMQVHSPEYSFDNTRDVPPGGHKQLVEDAYFEVVRDLILAEVGGLRKKF